MEYLDGTGGFGTAERIEEQRFARVLEPAIDGRACGRLWVLPSFPGGFIAHHAFPRGKKKGFSRSGFRFEFGGSANAASRRLANVHWWGSGFWFFSSGVSRVGWCDCGENAEGGTISAGLMNTMEKRVLDVAETRSVEQLVSY